jgi:hypothetical protein
MSVEGWPEPKGAVEFAARDLAAALGAQLLPQPSAYCVGGPVDGKLIRNRDGLYETPGPPPAYQPPPLEDDGMVHVTRYSYAPESSRPFYDSEVVTHFKLIAP